MNREIKFRAWSKATEKMMDWDFIKSHGNLNKLLCLGHVKVMQFTGLTDKNGKEIYEGDIIRLRTNFLKNAKKEEPEDYSEHIYTVTFFDGMFALCRGLPFNNGFVTGGVIEIIGNVFENPELLCN